MNSGMKRNVVGLAVALALAAPAAMAQDAAVSAASLANSLPKGFAGAAFQVPVAFGSGWGGVGVGLYMQTIDNKNESFDGGAGLNIGLGDAAKYVGADIGVGFSSLTDSSGSGDGFGEAGSMGVKLHTNLPGFASFAIGVQSIGRWGSAKDANSSSVFASASKYFDIGGQDFIMTLGLGDGSFTDDGDGAGLFGAASYFITPRVSVIAEYTGRFFNLAASAAPFHSLPMTVTAGVVNVAEEGGLDTEFGLSIGYGFSF